MEKGYVPLTEVGFSRWMIRNFWELKELVLTRVELRRKY